MSVYAQPIVYWIAALAGLVLALLTDGAGDVLALLLLGAPLIAIGRQVWRGRASSLR